MKRFSFLIAAGGTGSRIGGTPKQFRELQGYPLWMWSVKVSESLHALDLIHESVVVFPESTDLLEYSNIIHSFSVPLRFVCGGKSRRESVIKGLESCSGEFVLIHDGARPFLKISTCQELIRSTTLEEGAIPFLSISDALKKVSTSHNTLQPEDRSSFVITQTPQSFCREKILHVLQRSNVNVNDEAEAWVNEGRHLNMVEGDPLNFKITYEKDWFMASMIAASTSGVRTGLGFDIHPLVPGKKLILAGVHLHDFPLGLKGHSDGDVVAHAISDAILGAAGLPDIGTLFPDSDEIYANADSMVLLANVIDKVDRNGWTVQWIDIVINAQKPRLAGYLDQMKINIGSLVTGGDLKNLPLNIKVKSGEMTGAVGNLECIKCYAVATLARLSEAKHSLEGSQWFCPNETGI